MNHNRWHYVREISAAYLDKIGYFNLRTYIHEKFTKKLVKPDLQGWFSPANQEALKQTLKTYCSKVNSPKVLEIGTWKGLSTSVIAEFLKERNGHVYCVDSWQGNEDVGAFHKTAKYKDILSVFRKNMHVLGYTNLVHPFAGKCSDVLPQLKDNSFDLIFIDADHRMTPFLSDLKEARRLVKPGGIICGDDCEEAYDEKKLSFYTKYCEQDFQDGIHCGVVLGLEKALGFKKIRLTENSSFWSYREEKA